ncbi:MAG: hydrogenase expression/formation protein HypE [Clostridia bacterium]|nr:hydrogenase expression/formation protein HypE [Clostridia bacterium]
MKITLAEGAGGVSTARLISEVFAKHFQNPILAGMEDAAVLPTESFSQIALTTDSFVVTPLFFKGGDIGRLAVAGTVNDLLMRGATPRYLTAAFIIETGTDTDTLEKIARSMAETAKEAGVLIVAGDTKVVEGDGQVFINTTGVGFVPAGVEISASRAEVGDVVLLSGTLGDHHAALLSARMGIENAVESDAAPLTAMVQELLSAGIRLHAMRDVTRGGLGTVLTEIAEASGVQIELEEESLPLTPAVKSFCGLLGLSPLYMGNEGKLIALLPAEEAERAIEIVRSSPYGKNAAIIGTVAAGDGVILRTPLGGRRKIGPLVGEGLPRIC